jgi:hypothetical protein
MDLAGLAAGAAISVALGLLTGRTLAALQWIAVTYLLAVTAAGSVLTGGGDWVAAALAVFVCVLSYNLGLIPVVVAGSLKVT